MNFCLYCKRFLLLHLEMRRQVCVLIFFNPVSTCKSAVIKVETAFSAFLLPVKDCNKTRIPCSFCGTPHVTVHISMRFFHNHLKILVEQLFGNE